MPRLSACYQLSDRIYIDISSLGVWCGACVLARACPHVHWGSTAGTRWMSPTVASTRTHVWLVRQQSRNGVACVCMHVAPCISPR